MIGVVNHRARRASRPTNPLRLHGVRARGAPLALFGPVLSGQSE